MKIAVFSDTHGQTGNMLDAIRRHRPEAVFHLGDYSRDALNIEREFPNTPLYAVRGNCDFASQAEELLCVTLGGIRFFLSHGHRYGVKTGLAALIEAAREYKPQTVVFGHTHKAYFDCRHGMYLINPGAAGGIGRRGWAELNTDEKEPGALSCAHRFFDE